MEVAVQYGPTLTVVQGPAVNGTGRLQRMNVIPPDSYSSTNANGPTSLVVLVVTSVNVPIQ